MRTTLLALTVLPLMGSHASAGADSVRPGPQAMTFTATWDGTEQPYNLFVPSAHAAGQPIPLVVVLHGKGANWRSWFAATSVCDWAEREGYLVASPQGRGDWFYRGPGARDVLDVIADVERLCHVDADRIYLMGHSMGGWGTWYLGCTHPDLFAAIVPMSGFAPLDLLPNARHLAPLVIHGEADDKVPVRFGREAVERLRELKIDHEYLEVRDRGHESSLISEMFPLIGDHLRDRRRVARPTEVTLRAHTPTQGRAAWLSILETGHFPHVAGVDGRIDLDAIRIRTSSVRSFALDPAIAPLPTGSPLRVVVDHHDYDSPPLAPDQVLLFRRRHRSWMMTTVPRADAAPPPSPVVAHLASEPENLARAITEIMAADTGADVALMNADLIAPSLRSLDVTADDILDLYLRPEDELCVATLTAGVLSSAETWYPDWWGELIVAPPLGDVDAARPLRVVATRPLAGLLPVETEPLGMTLRELLFNHLTRTGAF
jgi:predicted esterase